MPPACPATRTILSVVCVFLTCGCSESRFSQPRQDASELPSLLFQSGFENSCRIVRQGLYDDIIGKDSTLAGKNDWVNYLEKEVTDDHTSVNYTGGDSTKRFARIIAEPGNEGNRVLWFWLNDYWDASDHEQKGRVQVDFNGMRGSYREIYQSVRVYLHDDMNTLKKYPDEINWLTISEFWNNGWWVKGEKYGFRVTLGIGKAAADTTLHFILKAEDSGFREVWAADNKEVSVPVSKWFTMEYYFKEGGHRDGRFYMAITPQGGEKAVVFDVRDYTHCTYDPDPDGLTSYNPMKLYTSKELIAFMKSHGKTLQMYWDDLKLWKYRRPETEE